VRGGVQREQEGAGGGTCYYDDSTLTSYWVAYPICESHLGTGRTESWGFDTTIDKKDQTKVSSGYGVSRTTT